MRDYLRPDEVDAMVQAARKSGRHRVRDAAMILMMFRHGLRTAELVALRWQQVDLKAGYLDVHRVKQGHDVLCSGAGRGHKSNRARLDDVGEAERHPGDHRRAAVRTHHQQATARGRLLERDLLLDRDVVAEHHDRESGIECVHRFHKGVAARGGDQRERALETSRCAASLANVTMYMRSGATVASTRALVVASAAWAEALDVAGRNVTMYPTREPE